MYYSTLVRNAEILFTAACMWLVNDSEYHRTSLSQNSNVVRFFNALKKDEPDTQIVYYQVRLTHEFSDHAMCSSWYLEGWNRNIPKETAQNKIDSFGSIKDR